MQPARATILVADDNPFDRRLLKRSLDNAGYDVLLANDGKQALELYLSHHPDIILLDMNMPEMDGRHIAQQIRQTYNDLQVPIIFITSHEACDATLATYLAAGGNDLLSKPLRPLVLNARLQNLLRSRELYQDLAQRHEQLQQRYEELCIEEDATRRILGRQLKPRQPFAGNLRILGTPQVLQHGSVLYSSVNAWQTQYILLGDLPCRGIPAGLAALPLFDQLEKASANNTPLPDLLVKLDQTLWSRTPEDVFMCGILIRYEVTLGQVAIWNGGMADVYVTNDRETVSIPSCGLTLGTDPLVQVRPHITYQPVAPEQRLVFYSDGITSFERPLQTFNREHIRQLVEQSGSNLFNRLQQAWQRARDESLSAHPVTLIELSCDPDQLQPSRIGNPIHEFSHADN